MTDGIHEAAQIDLGELMAHSLNKKKFVDQISPLNKKIMAFTLRRKTK